MNMTPIDPRLVAYKVESIRNFEYPAISEELQSQPRLLEVLWFLAWVSQPQNYAGGLSRFCSDFIAGQQDKIGTKTMRRVGASRKYSTDDLVAVLSEVPEHAYRDERTAEEIASFFGREAQDTPSAAICRMKDSLKKGSCHRNENPNSFHDFCVSVAQERLQTIFREVCDQPGIGFNTGDDSSYHSAMQARRLWFWPSVFSDLLEWMDKQWSQECADLAETRVAKTVWKWIEVAKGSKLAVWLNGSSRFGKTESIRALARCYPGRYRVVDTPETGSILSLCQAIARSLGLPERGSVATLRAEINLILSTSGLMLLFDEAHMLFPGAPSKYKRPQLIDFVRRVVMDQDLPVAFISTPQSYQEAQGTFARVTGFNMDQWNGRLLQEQPIELPESITREEMLAVAAVHFPGLDLQYLELIVRYGRASKGTLFGYIRSVSRVAWYLTKEAGKKSPRLTEIEQAIQTVLPAEAINADHMESEPPARSNAPKVTRREVMSAFSTPVSNREEVMEGIVQ